MMVKDWGRDGNRLELRNASGSGTLCGGAFEERYVRPIDDKGTGGIHGGDRAVLKMITLTISRLTF